MQDFTLSAPGRLGHTASMKLHTVQIHRDIRPILQEMVEQGDAPLWIEVIPGGETVEGRDGRKFKNGNPQAVVEAFDANGADIPIDIEHSTELKAPNGDPAPAMGWIKGLEAREDGSIWALVHWTDEGRWIVESRQYRYISPVFIYNAKSGEILRLTSAGLTNNPNLHLTALNQREPTGEPQPMKNLMQLLGLSADASEESAMNAVKDLQGRVDTAETKASEAVAANSNLDKFVPRADYDKAMNRAEKAEGDVKAMEEKALNQEIEDAIGQALKDGKITPATADYHRAACKEEGGLDRFREYTKAAPAVGGKTDMGDTPPGDNGATALNGEAKIMAEVFGNSAEDLAKYGDK